MLLSLMRVSGNIPHHHLCVCFSFREIGFVTALIAALTER